MNMKKINVIIMGAAGRDFHNFNTYFRGNPHYNVVCFTAAQIPGIAERNYPKQLAGKLYPKGIPIHSESRLIELIKKYTVDKVVFSYSDISHEKVMHKASIALANGANFELLGPKHTMLGSKKPVIAICAVRTGAGKSPTTRYVSLFFKKKGYRVVVIRHPMPYGDLLEQAVQRFATYDDLDKYKCTIEEREEYEPHIQNGIIVYAGVDYERILRNAEKDADIIIWDGGNNDFSFIKPDLYIVLADARRPGHEMLYHPGETNFRIADVLVISKADSARKEDMKIIMENIKKYNPKAKIVKAKLRLVIDKPSMIKGKRVIVIEDGPTLTHGGMTFGAGTIAAKDHGAIIVDAEKHAVGSIKDVYKKYGHLKKILPAMGYDRKQIRELEQTINRAKADAVIEATPINLAKLIRINKPIIEVNYEFDDMSNKFDKILVSFERRLLK